MTILPDADANQSKQSRDIRSFREYLAAQTPEVQREVEEAGKELDRMLLLQQSENEAASGEAVAGRE